MMAREMRIGIIGCGSEDGSVALTRPTSRVNVSTKWEENINTKYHVASFVMTLRMFGILRIPAFDFDAKKRTNVNATKSNIYHRQGQSK